MNTLYVQVYSFICIYSYYKECKDGSTISRSWEIGTSIPVSDEHSIIQKMKKGI
jgi:hypothetical protein